VLGIYFIPVLGVIKTYKWSASKSERLISPEKNEWKQKGKRKRQGQKEGRAEGGSFFKIGWADCAVGGLAKMKDAAFVW